MAMPGHHTLLPLATAALIGAAGLTAAGCGGGSSEPPEATYSVREVQERFQQLAGARLDTSDAVAGLTTMTQTGDTDSRRRLGSFVLTVAGAELDEEARDRLTVPGPGAALTRGNVTLRTVGGEPQEVARVKRIVASLGTPVERVRLPAEDTPCERQGINPDGGTGKAGTCLLGQQTLRTANADTPLELPQARITFVRGGIGRTISQRRYGYVRRERAKGAYVAVQVRIENTGDAPLTQPRPNLVVDGRRYGPDSSGAYLLNGLDDFPLQPGDTARTTFLYDVPASTGDPRTGSLELSADEELSSAEYASSIARLRLARPEADVPEGGVTGPDGARLTV